MTTYKYGDAGASVVLIQPVDDHDMAGIGNEVDEIRRLTGMEFRLIAVKADRWNDDLSPWKRLRCLEMRSLAGTLRGHWRRF